MRGYHWVAVVYNKDIPDCHIAARIGLSESLFLRLDILFICSFDFNISVLMLSMLQRADSHMFPLVHTHRNSLLYSGFASTQTIKHKLKCLFYISQTNVTCLSGKK